MKTALIAAALLLTATALVAAPSAAADPVQCDLDASDGFVSCRVPAAHTCFQVQVSGGARHCTA